MDVSWAFVTHCIAVAIVLPLTLASSVQTIHSIYSKKEQSQGGIYQDKDGIASKASVEAYSTKIQNVLATSISIAGLGVSLASAIRATLDGENVVNGWIQAGLWALVLAQRAQVLRERGPVQVYNLALIESISYLTITLLDSLTIYYASVGLSAESGTSSAFLIAAIVLSLIGFATCISYPRRPHVTFDGKVIDESLTVSAFSGYTYSWPAALLAQASRDKDLEYEDIPLLDSGNRTEVLINHYKIFERCGPLKALILAHRWKFIWQHLLTIIDSIFMIAPQFVMYRLLRLLEQRDAGADITTVSSLWVIALGLSVVLGAFTNNLMWWFCYQLNIAVRIQLGGMVFNKATNRKDVKGVVPSKETAIEMDMEQADHGEPQVQPVKAEEIAEDIEDQLKKTRQGVVNLIGVDAKRVSDFATMVNMFLGAVSRLAFSFTMLGKLLGWQPLLAGIAVQLLTLPANIYFSKKYTNTTNALMEYRDKILAAVNEMLGGIRQIKFSALEDQWQKKIFKIRNDQLQQQWRCFLYDTVLICIYLTGPVLLSATTIGVYAILNGGLPPSIAFTTISVLGQIEGTLAWLPELTTIGLDAWVSLKRIGEYLSGPEKQVITTPGQGSEIVFQDAAISWPSDDKDNHIFTLRNVNIEFPVGELSVISGRTGSGKSLLLAAVLGEVELLSGSITAPRSPTSKERCDEKANRGNWVLPNSVAYVSQQPWLENATIKNNILFGLPYDDQRYCSVKTACALDKDLEILTDGDLTEIGANGINLSGGQKWRITLARALYSRAGILVMDDIFSAVDAHVGKHIFEQALTGNICHGRTRILVTHHVSLCLPATKYEVHLGDGTVEHAGLVSEMDRSGILQEIIDEVEDEFEDDSTEARLASIKASAGQSGRRQSRASFTSSTSVKRKRTFSRSSAKSDVIDNGGHAGEGKATPKKFVEDEKKETGWVKFAVYKAYLDACGGIPFWTIVAITFGGYEGLLLGRSWILRLWTESYESKSNILQDWHKDSNIFVLQSSKHIGPNTIAGMDGTMKFYLSLYFGIACALIVEGTLRYLWVFYGSIKASRKLFEDLTYAVLRAPLRWLDTMPVGRVLNRFSADFNQVDGMQAYNFAFGLYNFMVVIGIVIAGVIVSPVIIVCAVVLLTICGWYALYYLVGARQIKRLESTAKSPVFELFSTTLAGVSTIRAFDKQSTYIQSMYTKLDTHARMLYYLWLFNRWLSWRLSCIGALFSFLVAALIINMKGMDAALSGFALGFTLQYTEAVTWLLRNFAGIEMNMNSTERILEYSNIQIEDQTGGAVPASWPTEGRLDVEDLVVGYADDLDPVLKGLTFSVNKNERVGVVGRTGAGKSSLTLALFRFLEARSGNVCIDGIDIAKIKLRDLRSRLAIIPQDPVLFSGTVRTNLDPFDEHTDQELRDALDRVHLTTSATTTGTHTPTPEPNGVGAATAEANGKNPTKSDEIQKNVNPFNSLSSPISEGGLNLSQGQRQLLCLARSIVSRPKIMILDEATSAVDKSTDALIQRSIREEFQDATLIVIAHRLSTIADFDRILVMDEGKVSEYDAPAKLLGIENGVFKGMVESSGETEVLRKVILGEDDAEVEA